MGDPSGIGPEVIINSFVQKPGLFNLCRPFVIGDFGVIKKFEQGHVPVVKIDSKDTNRIGCLSNRILYVIDLCNVNLKKFKYGRVSASYGKASLAYIDYAVNLLRKNRGYRFSIVTAPVSKESIVRAGIDFKGHTEYLAKVTKVKNVAMLMVSDRYKVLLLTRHIPLKEIGKNISKKLILDQINTASVALKRYFNIEKPRIYLCPLNPHGGQDSFVGSEEKKIIIPAIGQLQHEGFDVFGPVNVDYALSIDNCLIVCAYHDQAMVSLRLLCGRKFVNLTCGLPFIRVSPAHGTAFDIAGKGCADPTSMIKAIEIASRLGRV
ncbi:MAG: 4-hydroxythreonine-4-phosphate dehydrogenase PdxA [Elusimicrobia bacterium CG_4_10_14_0_8_um_filter_37_32]|nr:MAG: 4-hydroxythreonine-4-phosphate dehydrogenase PdxA [Elusimicrobia bacterium CG_4_10_14_0_8_um_filter_37_32]